MIEVKDVYKEFNTGNKKSEVNALNGINFSCTPGRIFGLLGPNGAGKTTLLRIIAGILKATSGDVYIAGLSIEKEAHKARGKIGFLSGNTGCYDSMTPEEYIQFFADLYEIDRSVFKKRKQELFELLNLSIFSKRKISQLSTGNKQKVAICRTIIHDPEIIIFDEPTSGLDIIAAKNVIDLVKDCRVKSKTVIFSSHIMSEVDYLCDDLAIINKGDLLYKGSYSDWKKNMKAASTTEEFINAIISLNNEKNTSTN